MRRGLTGLVLVVGLLRCGTATDESAHLTAADVAGDVLAAADVLDAFVDSTPSDTGPLADSVETL
ncbi:MAG: hypothetical protein ACI9OJ_003964 [Myxococcota bacterium]|jgi:hypothetical protein